jgi:hypothetical protein
MPSEVSELQELLGKPPGFSDRPDSFRNAEVKGSIPFRSTFGQKIV